MQAQILAWAMLKKPGYDTQSPPPQKKKPPKKYEIEEDLDI